MQLGYILLYVADVSKTVPFYESAFRLTRKMVHESGYAEMETGTTILAFVNHSAAEGLGIEFNKTTPDGPAAAFDIALVTDAVQPAYDRAVQAGAKPVTPPEQKPWGQTVCYVRDLDGFLVEICSPVSA